MKKLIIVALLLSILVHSSCTNDHIKSDATADIRQKTLYERDSIQKDAIAEQIVKDALYEFAKDTIRREWVSSHSYMWYKSEVYIAESCSYDKNVQRVTNQVLGTHKKSNAFCVNRRTKVITWLSNNDGADTHTEYLIKQIDEHPNCTSFGVKSRDGEKLVFNIPDDGKKIYVLDNDATLTFVIKQ